MLGGTRGEQYEFFVGSLRDLIPDEHVLARVDRVLDLSWLRADVADLYCPDNGRPGIAPEVAVRLMLAGFLLGIVYDRRLLREAAVNIAIRWFCGFGLTAPLPDHSTLTRIRQRWGDERFRRIFERTVQVCMSAGIAKGEVVHVDASLIRADVSWESLAAQHVEAVTSANGKAVPDAEPDRELRHSKKTGRFKKVCTTDPDASMATTARNRRLEPSYKQHGVIDDLCGVVLDVEVTTGEVNEGDELVPALARVEAATGVPVATVTADAGYAYAKVYGALERRGTAAVIPPKAEPIRSPVPMRRFRYDAKHDILKCPRGKVLKPGRPVKHGRFFTSRARDCRGCDLAALCLSKGRVNKAVVVGDDYPALLRARRRRESWSEEEHRLYQRHRWRSEGYHGEAKTWHGLARAVRRGLGNMKIQAYLTAAAVNLKRLAAALAVLLCALAHILARTAFAASPTPSSPAQPERGFFNSPTLHHLLTIPCHTGGMSDYHRPRIPGATVFFTVALAERGSRLLVENIEGLREAVRVTRAERPFAVEAWVVLPDHLHCVWTLPEGDADYSMRWAAIKTRFSRGLDAGATRPSHVARREKGLWQRRFWEHHVRSEEDLATCVRYCWINPVKHGFVERPEEWPYSSVHQAIRDGGYDW